MENKVRELRKAKKMTLQELSDKAGIDIMNIQKIEKGERDLLSCKFETILKLTRALNCNIYHLFGCDRRSFKETMTLDYIKKIEK